MATCSEAAGMKPKKRAFAGVGIPMKFSVWFVSTLNLARRTAESAGTMNTKYVKEDTKEVWAAGGI